jgi:hypothetical protein
MDNASTCDVLARTAGKLLLAKYNINFHTDNARIRCLAHVVNLIVQSILADLEEADHPDIDDYYLGNKHLPIHYDPDEDEEIKAWEMDSVSDNEELDDAEKEFKVVLPRSESVWSELQTRLQLAPSSSHWCNSRVEPLKCVVYCVLHCIHSDVARYL